MRPRKNDIIPKFGSIGKFTQLLQKSPVSDLLIECSTDENGNKVYHYSSDLSLLFRQRKLENMGLDTLSSFLDALVSKSDSLASLRSHCSDDELMSVIKSRHIQSPAELLAWSKFLDKSQQEIKRLHKEQVEKAKKSKEKTEVSVESKSD